MTSSSDDLDGTISKIGVVAGIIVLVSLVVVLGSHTSILGKVATFGGPSPAYGGTSTSTDEHDHGNITTIRINRSGVACVDMNANPYAGTAQQPARC